MFDVRSHPERLAPANGPIENRYPLGLLRPRGSCHVFARAPTAGAFRRKRFSSLTLPMTIFVRCVWAVCLSLCVFTGRAAESSRPVAIIFDTDMDSDCDDAAALAMLHALADRGEVRILATTVSSKHAWAVPCTDAINTYFGRPALPIGAPKGAGPREQGSKYAKQIAAEFPHDLRTTSEAPDATEIYRKVLAAEPDGSVVIVTVGDLTNLRYLIESKADAISPLDGIALVRKKVRQWVCMGSRYPADLDPKPWGNFKPDPESTVRAITGWPTLITFTGGGDFANLVATGKRLGELPKNNPVRRVYELYFDGEAKDRHSADLISVHIAARGAGKPWKLVKEGYNFIFPDGRHEWRLTPDNPLHEYVSALADGIQPSAVIAEMNALIMHQPRASR
jgi:hypothetical protein